MEPTEPHKLVVHTGDQFAMELEAQKYVDEEQRAVAESKQKAAAAYVLAHPPASHFSVEGLKLFLAIVDAVIVITVVRTTWTNPQNTSGIVAILNLLALASFVVLMLVLFFVQATVATLLEKRRWRFLPIAAATIIFSPLSIVLFFLFLHLCNLVLTR